MNISCVTGREPADVLMLLEEVQTVPGGAGEVVVVGLGVEVRE